MAKQHEEQISMRFLLGLGLVLGSFFWLHAEQQHSDRAFSISPEAIPCEIIDSPHSDASILYPDNRTTAALDRD